MKKVIVIGAGIAGMSAGIYALQSGFEVTILEQHTIPGGNCTSWKRGGYLFEGGMHWLTGSDKKQPLHRLWHEVGALQKDTSLHIRDPFVTCHYNGQMICLHRDLDQLKKHLYEVSPEDAPMIRRLCKDVKAFSSMRMPAMDIPGLKTASKEKSSSMLKMLPKMLPAILRMGSLNKISILQYVRQFHHPAIRLLLSHTTGDEYSATSLMFTMACLSSGDGGYVEGGSLKMAASMANCFKDLGGVIQYGKPVEKIIVENGRAAGVIADGIHYDADAVIVASDTLSAVDRLFERPLQEVWADNMRKNTVPATCTFLCLGVEADLSSLPEAIIYPLERPFHFAGKQISDLSINNYANYPGYAPKGCTALTLILEGNYDYWRTAKEDGSYLQKKQELAEQVIDRLTDQLPVIKDKVAVRDVATPLTYERYCGTFHGSWMTIQPPGHKLVTYPCKPESIRDLYFAGQRLQPPGGLPVAVFTGRQAAQYLCRDNDTVFRGKI